MKTKTCMFILFTLFMCYISIRTFSAANSETSKTSASTSDVVEAFISRLQSLKATASDEIFALSYQSIIDVIESKPKLTSTDTSYIAACLGVFSDTATVGNGSKEMSYLDRSRYLTIAWNSPTDKALSFLRLRLPANWNKNETYPLYVDLHGLSTTADNPIDFLTRYYRTLPDPTIAFEDGYHVAPLARGNLWYYGISETDVWEAIDVIENMFSVDPARKYLVGHSMGGFGTWMIASKSANIWAAIGIEAGALWYDGSALSEERINYLSQLPTYFVVGTNDGLYNVNLQAYNLLLQSGNPNLSFVTFNGGHEKLTPNVENMYLWIKDFVNEDYSATSSFKMDRDNFLQINPNPVTGNATFRINLKKKEQVKIILSDITGKMAAVIADREMEPGESFVQWDSRNLHPGVYFCSFITSNKKECGRLIIM